MILDIHTHVPPEAQWPVFLNQCRDNGVCLAATSSLGSWARYPDAEDVRAANDQAAAFASRAGPVVRWFAYLNPQNEEWEAELARACARGARGVKLWVSLKDPGTGSLERVPPVLRAAAERKLPVLVHTFQRTDANLPGEITIPEFADLTRAVPAARLIAAHAGGNWRECLGLLRGLPNAWVDVCGGYPETGMVEALVDDLGADRVVYGSDALGRSMPSQIRKVTLAALPERTKRAILWGNGAGLLGLTPEDVRAARAAARRLEPSTAMDMPALDEDHFCYCGTWPFRPLESTSPAALEERLRGAGIRRAFAADARGVFAVDVAGANRAFAAETSGHACLAPLATMVPQARNWAVTLDEARDTFAGGILHPYLHNWRLDDPACEPFFAACARHGFPLWVNACTGDARFRHRGTLCREVTAAELVAFLRQAPPRNRYVIQGASVTLVRAGLEHDPQADHVRFDISRLTDTTRALRDTVQRFGWSRLVLGSEYPLRDLRQVRTTARVLCEGRAPGP
ncbi:MAG: amidohydrolase family protein [Lentisphaeria bacterium]|nr:amidohydrolase family protein [Lentisphaeria bacterium]